MIKIFLNYKDTQKDVAATMVAYFLLRAILNFLSSAQTYNFFIPALLHPNVRRVTTWPALENVTERLVLSLSKQAT